MSILTARRGRVLVVTIDRPHRRNAVDPPTATDLTAAFKAFDADDELDVAVLTGAAGTFSAGADLKAMPTDPDDAQVPPMGPTHLRIKKPTIAAIEGHAVGGGFELALWCDLRVASRDATFGMAHRRWGLPTIDGGTFRLPRLIGQARALDLLLTGRFISAIEAQEFGLVTRLVEPGTTLTAAVDLARTVSSLPQTGVRHDRAATLEQWDLSEKDAVANEVRHARSIVESDWERSVDVASD